MFTALLHEVGLSTISSVFLFVRSLVTCTALLCSLEHRHLSA